MTESQARLQFVFLCWAVILFMILTIIMQTKKMSELSNLAQGYRTVAAQYGSEIKGVRNAFLESESRNVLLAEEVVRLHKEVLKERMIQRITKVNPKAPAVQIVDSVLKWSETYEVSPVLALAIIEQESHYNPRAIGPIGERGLMQISKPTAPILGLNWNHAFDVDKNIQAGVKYLSWHLAKFGNERRALVRYNGGERYPRLVQQRKI